MRVLTAKEVNFVSGGHIDGQADPYSLSGGFQGTGMPNTSGNSIGDVNYSPPTQGEACANAADLGSAATIAGVAGIIIGGSNPVGWLAGALAALGAGSALANDCSSSGSGNSSDSSSASDSGGSCTAPSTDGGG
jgi:hypothetical protein